MKKSINLLLAALILASGHLMAQEGKIVQKPANVLLAPAHRIVFQMSTGDTLAHKALMKQLGNISKVAPGTQIEVVCHGPGLDMLVADKSTVSESIKKHSDNGIAFLACEFSMKERNVEKSKIISESGFVAAGIIEIVSKQEQGWSYIKSGF